MVDPYSKIWISNGAITYKIHTIEKYNIFKIYINTLLLTEDDEIIKLIQSGS